MKKVFAGILSAALLAGCAFAAVGCGNNYGETYTGAVSNETYTSSESAVQGFLATELSGMAVTAVYVDSKVEKEYTAAEAADVLTISAEDAEGLQSVEQIEVQYTETEGAAQTYSLLAADRAETKTFKRIVYVLRYTDGGYKYFAPVLAAGETLTASYFDSVFDLEKYLNCTMDMSGSVQVSAMGQSQKVKISGVAKCTETALYSTSKSEDYTMDMYVLDTAKGIQAVTGMNGSWQLNNYIFDEMFGGEFDSVSEYLLANFDMQFGGLDHTCFKKTSTGYALREGMGSAFIQKLLGQYMPDYGDMLGALPDFDLSYEINIADGRVANLKMKFNLSISVSGYTITEKLDETVKFSKFGSTTVTVPAEVQALVG